MSQANPSDLQQATENVDPSQLAHNLNKQSSEEGQPQQLDQSEQTPFIDESLRTDDK